MCSWCWAYRPAWLKLKESLPERVSVRLLLGGLAPDSEDPMPDHIREMVQGHWRNIENQLGTRFNHDFWTRCQPRRDTWKACRAVAAAAPHGHEEEMILAIQEAYYLRAMNPSEPDTLVQLAGEIGLDKAAFREALFSPSTETEFARQLNLSRVLGVNSFPSLRLEHDGHIHPIPVNYRDHHPTLEEIQRTLAKK